MNDLKFTILTIEEANEMKLPNIKFKRKSIDKTKLITHYEDLVTIYKNRGLMTLELDEFGNEIEVIPEFPFPIKSGNELDVMLNSKEWTNK